MYFLHIFLAFSILFLCPSDSFAEMYKWIDENGKVHFSDQKPPEGVEIQKEYEEIDGRSKRSRPSDKRRYLSENMPKTEPISKPPERNMRNPETKNPVMALTSRSAAEGMLKEKLLKKYPDNYSLVLTLLKSGMKAYDELCQIPDTEVSNRVLARLTARYMPSWNLILTLYKSEMKAYSELQKK